MIFSDPRWLTVLLALPALALLELWAASRAERALRRLVGDRSQHVLLVQRRPAERLAGAALRLGAVAALLIGAARPEWGREVVRRGATGSDIVLAIDLSASMDARDVPPGRIAEAQREALAVIDRLAGSRVGVVGFAGDAVRLCPLTLDRGTARLVVESLSSGSISMPGTDLGRGLRMAQRVLPRGRRQEQAIVLWTDGEDLEQGARGAIDEVARAGIRVFVVGVGTRAGDVVPVLDGQGRTTDIKRDESGNQVRSRLDEPLLRHLARRTRGAYFSASRPGGELPRLLSALGSVGSAARGERLIERPKARFGMFAAIAALLLAFERLRPRRRRESFEQPPIHSEKYAAAAAMLLVLFTPAVVRAESDWARADRAYRAGRMAEAESLYARRLERGDKPALRFNRATAKALRGKGEAAAQELGALTSRTDKTGLESGYNLGTIHGRDRRYEPALEALRRVLERNPKDEDARWNYELLMSRRESDEKPKESQQQQQPQPKPSGGGGGQSNSPGQSQQQPSGGPQPTPQTGQSTPQTPTGGGGSMTRSEAERILDALQELSRSDQQRQRRVRVTRERQGRDW